MTPGTATLFRAALQLRVVIELVIPNYIIGGTVIDLIKGCTEGLRCRVAHTVSTLLQRWILATRIDELLHKGLVVLDLSSERTSSCCSAFAGRKCLRIKLEHEPPVDRVSWAEKRPGAFDGARRQPKAFLV